MPIKVAIAEDNHFLARTIKEKLDLFPGEIEFRFRATDGADLLKLLQTQSHPEVILMDIEMPVMDGIEATARVAGLYPQIKIIILTVFDDEQRIFHAIQAGAMGYLLKDEPAGRLLESIRMIVDGGAPMSPSIAAKSLQILRHPERLETTSDNENFDLSKREIDVLEQLSQGLDYHEIAENLYISPATVRKHIENIYRKLQVDNKMRAVNKAIRHKLI